MSLITCDITCAACPPQGKSSRASGSHSTPEDLGVIPPTARRLTVKNARRGDGSSYVHSWDPESINGRKIGVLAPAGGDGHIMTPREKKTASLREVELHGECRSNKQRAIVSLHRLLAH